MIKDWIFFAKWFREKFANGKNNSDNLKRQGEKENKELDKLVEQGATVIAKGEKADFIFVRKALCNMQEEMKQEGFTHQQIKSFLGNVVKANDKVH